MSVRTLPLRVTPVEGESFASLADRLAAVNQAPLLTLLAWTGVLDREHFRTLPTGYGIVLEVGRLRRFAAAAALPPERVADTLLARYGGVALELGDVDPAAPGTIRRAAAREWLYAAGSHVCPDCIQADAAWRTVWKLPWSFACVRHRRLLASRCPACGARTGAGRRDGRTAPVLPSLIPSPGVCQNPLPPGTAVPGRRMICGYPLSAVETASLDGWQPLIEAQAQIDASLATAPDPRVHAWFRRLRSLTALLLAVAQVEDLGRLPPIAQTDFFHHVAEREAVREHNRRLRSRGVDGRRGQRTRVWLAAPTDASLLAAVLPTAVQLAAASASEEQEAEEEQEEQDAAEAVIATLVERARERYPHQLRALSSWFHFPADLRRRWERLSDATSPRFIARRAGEQANEWAGIEPRSVPRLFDRALYRAHLARLFAGLMREDDARAFCSLALVRAGGARTWMEAGERLGLEGPRAARQANNAVYKLQAAGRRDAFWQALREAACRLPMAQAVDYRERERQFAGLSAIPPAIWTEICRVAGVGPGKPPARNRYASAWLWAELTGCDWREAPALGGLASESQHEVYRRMERDLIPRLEIQLRAYGAQLVQRSARPPPLSRLPQRRPLTRRWICRPDRHPSTRGQHEPPLLCARTRRSGP